MRNPTIPANLTNIKSPKLRFASDIGGLFCTALFRLFYLLDIYGFCGKINK